MKHLLPILLTALLAPAALAHDMPLDHAHPHPDVSMGLVLIGVILLSGLGLGVVRTIGKHNKGKDHDPR